MTKFDTDFMLIYLKAHIDLFSDEQLDMLFKTIQREFRDRRDQSYDD